MCQTIFQIPHEWRGLTVFGWGWALIACCVLAAITIYFAARASTLKQAAKEWAPFFAFLVLLVLFVLPAVEQTSQKPDGSWSSDGIAIRGYGVMMGVAIVAAVALAAFRSRQFGIPFETVMSMATWLVVPGIIGGRVFYLAQYWQDFQQPTMLGTLGAALNLTQGGLVVYGAFIGGFLGFCLFMRKYGGSFFAMADLVVPSLMVGLALGRLGCFLNGCCYGGPTDKPWGVRFPPESVPYAAHLSEGRMLGFRLALDDDQVIVSQVETDSPATEAGLEVGMQVREIAGVPLRTQSMRRRVLGSGDRSPVERLALARQLLEQNPREISLSTSLGDYQVQLRALPEHTEPIHPTQLYSAISAALVCLFLLAVEPFLHGHGKLFAMWITVYPPIRFLLEIIRTDETSFAGTSFTISQNVSLLIGVLAIGLWGYLWKTGR